MMIQPAFRYNKLHLSELNRPVNKNIHSIIKVLLLLTMIINIVWIDLYEVNAEEKYNTTVILQDNTEKIILDTHIEYIRDVGLTFPLGDIMDGMYDDQFASFIGKG